VRSRRPQLRTVETNRRVTTTQYYCAASLDGYIAELDDSLGWLFTYDGRFEGEGAEPGPMSDGGAYERFYDGVGALVSGSTTFPTTAGRTKASRTGC